MNDTIKKMTGLLKEVIGWHSNQESADYMQCDISPCSWCEAAKKLIEETRQTEVGPVKVLAEEIEKFKAAQPTDEEVQMVRIKREAAAFKYQMDLNRTWPRDSIVPSPPLPCPLRTRDEIIAKRMGWL